MSHNVSIVALDRCVLATFHCLLLPLITWKAHTWRWGRPGHCIKRLVYSWGQAGVDTRQWIRYINHSKTNTCRHLYRVKANICLGFVFVLTIVSAFSFWPRVLIYAVTNCVAIMATARPRITDGADVLWIWGIAVYVLNIQTRTDDKGCSVIVRSKC